MNWNGNGTQGGPGAPGGDWPDWDAAMIIWFAGGAVFMATVLWALSLLGVR